MARRRPAFRVHELGRYAVLYPAIAEAARRLDARSIGLVDVGTVAGLNLQVDRVGISYDNGQTLGDPTSRAQRSASIVGRQPLPGTAIPAVAVRVAVGTDPVDVTSADDVSWLHACLTEEGPDLQAALAEELALAATDPPHRVAGDLTTALVEAIALVPDDVVPVVTTTWALSRLPLEGRLRFLQQLDRASAVRPLAWVSVEGVGVAPAVPTLGDRPASGHSIVAVSVASGADFHVAVVGRCWRRGQMLSWISPVTSLRS
ncbi:DUF2332 family protein [Microlunatus sp. Y2014]|uniref:DUF2332 family protein n=1 Tax=Microlunatus sp. Y2014 TaxID=3418488 RepID=UPI003DA780A7